MEDTVVYVPNTGSMLNLVPPQVIDPPCVLSMAPENSNRKYKYTVEMVQVNQTYVGIHSALANKMVLNALKRDLIPECSGFSDIRREVKICHKLALKASSKKSDKSSESRIDFELLFAAADDVSENDSLSSRKRKYSKVEKRNFEGDNATRSMLVEVKSVTLGPCDADRSKPNLATFPDSVSSRAKKHAECLAQHVGAGGRAAILFLIQRDDCNSFSISPIDMAYKEAVQEAQAAGVLILPYKCKLNPNAGTVELIGKVPFID